MAIIRRGDTTIWEIPVLRLNDEPLDLRGHTVWVTVKAAIDDTDAEALYQHYIRIAVDGTVEASAGMRLVNDDPALGRIEQELTPTESAAFEAGAYIYDVQVMVPDVGIDGKPRIYTPISGASETVELDITQAIVAPEAAP